MLRQIVTLFVALVVGLAVFVWVENYSSSFQNCIDQESAKASSDQANNQKKSLTVILRYARCTERFADLHNSFITALATVLLAVITLGLILSGVDQLRTTRAQMRAYVWAEINPSKNLDDPNFGVSANIKNSGQTPAYEVHTWSNTQPVAEPPPNGFVFAGAPEHIPGPRYVVNPSSKHFMQAFPEVALTVEERFAIRDGFLVLYFWGEVRYRDTFGENRMARFRLRLAAEGLHGGQWAYCDEGNDAD
jgi:hypothetical protein